MDAERTLWNQRQQVLRRCLNDEKYHEMAIALFLHQHAMVHCAQMAEARYWSFEDEALKDLDDRQIRSIPINGEHSIAWILWHLTRIEDMTMNVLVSGNQQIFIDEDWKNRLEITSLDTGNNTGEQEVEYLSRSINLPALREYRLTVGRRTRGIVSALPLGEFHRKVNPDRLSLLVQQGAITARSMGVLDYWASLTIAGLLLMPPTRHPFIHMNEALRIRRRLGVKQKS